MNHRLIVRRYARGLARAVDHEPEFKTCLDQLRVLAELIKTNPVLAYALTSAFLPVHQKKLMVEELLKAGDFDPRVVRLVRMLAERAKMALLPEILDELPGVWAEEKGIEVFEIDSAVDLTEEEKSELQKTLEEKWKKPVRLHFRLNPDIIGGLVLKKGNVFYDVSVRGGLLKLKEIVSQR
ncbi:MAG: ATP synthase F1 subunit delta [Candidatus Saccharicenans sp.]|nr:ATP synthase F1 subunit delta [Candidatus Saccharicenans sp.]